jgi:hypothetical protein
MDGPHNTLGALTWAAAVELQVLAGTNVTTLQRNLLPDDTTAYVRSTLGFPPSGYFKALGLTFYYASKTPSRFVGLVCERTATLPEQTLLVSDVRSIVPDTYELFWVFPYDEE